MMDFDNHKFRYWGSYRRLTGGLHLLTYRVSANWQFLLLLCQAKTTQGPGPWKQPICPLAMFMWDELAFDHWNPIHQVDWRVIYFTLTAGISGILQAYQAHVMPVHQVFHACHWHTRHAHTSLVTKRIYVAILMVAHGTSWVRTLLMANSK